MSVKLSTAWCISILAVVYVIVGCAGTQINDEIVDTPRPGSENIGGFEFPVGFEEFNPDDGINFLLNRTYSMGYGRYEDLAAAGLKIETRDDLIVEMTGIAEEAAGEGRFMNAAFYHRAAEFYAVWSDPAKPSYYHRFIEYFYLAIEDDEFELIDIPYGNTFLPVMRIAADTGTPKGTVIVHGGYDGFKEELYSTMRYLAANGYEVISFDVPWMGRARTADTAGLDYEWEKLVGLVLDHYKLDDATLFGISLGGWLAIRAAAFEPRISRVIASSVSFDVNQYAGRFGQAVARFSMKRLRKMTNNLLLDQMESDPQQGWFFDHLMHVTNRPTPIEAADVLSRLNEENLHSELVTQDVLILTGRDDLLVPFKMHTMQVRALENAASVTPLVFTVESEGQNHCQVGNLGLALSLVVEWLDER